MPIVASSIPNTSMPRVEIALERLDIEGTVDGTREKKKNERGKKIDNKLNKNKVSHNNKIKTR